ncbi:MAG: pyridoxal-phosphate dependent enzyme [Aggregatilineales bacterium]
MSPDPLLMDCEQCGNTWLDAGYDYTAVHWPDALRNRAPTMWRYTELLPLDNYSGRVSIGEGYTPIIRAEGLQAALHHPTIFIKDERQSPTGSFKDRQGALSVSILKAHGLRECVLASTGNAAAAYAAYCARSGIKLWVFLTSMAPAEKMRELGLYGAEVVKVTGTYDEAKQIAADFARRRGLYFDRGAKAVPGKESMKTIAYEIAEQLGLELTEGERWIAPDWYVQAVSGGIGPLGVMKGFQELKQMGLIDRLPKLAIVQVDGCSPMVKAFKRGDSTAEPVTPNTRITVLSTGDPSLSYTMLYETIQESGGAMEAADDGEAFRAMRRLARVEGLSVEPAAAVAFAGLEKLIASGTISPDETVLVNCSGHTFPAEKHILEDQYVLDLELGADGMHASEGLSAALAQLDEQIRTVVIIDDNPQDSRLVRRLLQAHKNYRVFEANDPRDGIELVRQRKPGLVITDLTMPGMDGFTLLENLKADPSTARIPVIVLSAKTLTPPEERRLKAQQASIWQKGNFNTRELVDHVVTTLNDAVPVEILPSEPDPVPPKRAPVVPVLPTELPGPVHVVLVVDDNARDVRLVRRILEAEKHYRVSEASSGEMALAAIRQVAPDLVLLDLLLPDISGFDLLDQMRAAPDLRSIPVIVLTAKDLTSAERERLGDVTLWHKANLDRRRLLQSVESALP